MQITDSRAFIIAKMVGKKYDLAQQIQARILLSIDVKIKQLAYAITFNSDLLIKTSFYQNSLLN